MVSIKDKLTRDWYRQAEQRFESDPQLAPYRVDLLREWDQGAEHYEWVATAEVRDLLDWAVAVHDDEDEET